MAGDAAGGDGEQGVLQRKDVALLEQHQLQRRRRKVGRRGADVAAGPKATVGDDDPARLVTSGVALDGVAEWRPAGEHHDPGSTKAPLPMTRFRLGRTAATISASKPMPAIMVNPRPLARPRAMRRVVPVAGEREAPSRSQGAKTISAASTLAVPKSSTATAGAAPARDNNPFTASLASTSPPTTTITSVPAGAAAAKSVASPGPRVSATVARAPAPSTMASARASHRRRPRRPAWLKAI